jgi:hypothetical protein
MKIVAGHLRDVVGNGDAVEAGKDRPRHAAKGQPRRVVGVNADAHTGVLGDKLPARARAGFPLRQTFRQSDLPALVLVLNLNLDSLVKTHLGSIEDAWIVVNYDL